LSPLELILSEIPEKWKTTARFARGIQPSGSPPDGGTKSMGGAVRRPPNAWGKIRK